MNYIAARRKEIKEYPYADGRTWKGEFLDKLSRRDWEISHNRLNISQAIQKKSGYVKGYYKEHDDAKESSGKAHTKDENRKRRRKLSWEDLYVDTEIGDGDWNGVEH